MATAQPLLQDPGSELEVAVGREHFRNGQVALTVHGSGEVDVVQLRSGAERDWHATLADDRLRALAEELAELDVAALRPHAGGRDPDDDPVRVALRARRRAGPRGAAVARRPLRRRPPRPPARPAGRR